MEERKNESQDLDAFWDQMMSKSAWARKQAGSGINKFQESGILAKSADIQKNVSPTTPGPAEELRSYQGVRVSYSTLIIAGLLVVDILLLMIIPLTRIQASAKKYCAQTYAVGSMLGESGCSCPTGRTNQAGVCREPPKPPGWWQKLKNFRK